MNRHSSLFVSAVMELFLVVFCFLGSPSQVFAADIIDVSGKESISLLENLDFIRDPSGKLSITDVLDIAATTGSKAFQPTNGKFSQGFTQDVFWLRVTMVCLECAAQRRLMVATPPFIDDIRLYTPDSKGSYSEFRAGDHVPLKQRAQATRDTVFPLDLDKTPHTFYLRVQSTSTITLSLKLFTPDNYALDLLQSNMLHGIFLGLLLASALISLISAIWMRQLFFLIATLYLLGYGFQQFTFNGYDQLFIFPDNPALADRTVGMSSSLMPGLFIFFFLSYLDPSQHFPRLTMALLWLAWLSMAATCLSAIGFYPWLAPHVPKLVLSVILLAMPLIFMMRRHRPQHAKLMLWMFLPGAFAVIPQLLRNLGYLPANFWTTHLWQVSVFLQMQFAAFVILLRVREEERKRNHVQERELAQRDFLNLVAHELRNPLAIVHTSLANIEAHTDARHPELAPRFRRIDTALAKLNGLVNNALAEGRLNIGKVQIDPKLLTPSKFSRLIQTQHVPSESHPLQITLPEDNVPILLDVHWLSLAVLNLIDNAIKYSPQGGPVSLEILRTHGKLIIRVGDRGIGMTPQVQASIGHRFFRADNTRTLPGVRGVGLGLFLARQIAELHGGTLQVASTPEVGSIFTIEIPVPV